MTHYLHSEPAITNPGDFIASIPGVLGYYPQESVIIVSAYCEPGNPVALYGPVFRVDLSLADRLQEVLNSAPPEDVIAHFAIVVTRIPNSATAQDAVDALLNLEDHRGMPLIDACWHTSEIAHYTPYSLVFGPPVRAMVRAGVPDTWVAGTVGSVIAQPTMSPLLAQGALPELDRDDTRAYFDPSGGQWEASSAECAELHRRGAQLASRIALHPETVRVHMERACEVLRNVAPRPLVGQAAPASVADVFASSNDAQLIATALTRSQLRDCLFNVALEHPLRTGAAMLAIGRGYGGIIRANALSIWAVIAVNEHLANWAAVALECAEDAVPNHSLSCILKQLLRAGQHDNVLVTASLGCDEMWEMLADLDGADEADLEDAS